MFLGLSPIFIARGESGGSTAENSTAIYCKAYDRLDGKRWLTFAVRFRLSYIYILCNLPIIISREETQLRNVPILLALRCLELCSNSQKKSGVDLDIRRHVRDVIRASTYPTEPSLLLHRRTIPSEIF